MSEHSNLKDSDNQEYVAMVERFMPKSLTDEIKHLTSGWDQDFRAAYRMAYARGFMDCQNMIELRAKALEEMEGLKDGKDHNHG